MASQIETLTQQLNVKANENHNYATRDANLVAHIERLEGQLQHLMQASSNEKKSQQERYSPSTDQELSLLRTKMADLDKKVLGLQLERDQLQESHQQIVNILY